MNRERLIETENNSAKKNNSDKKRVLSVTGKVLMWLVGALIIFIGVFPFLWVILSSFKPLTEIQSIKFHFFPQKWTGDNYVALFSMKNRYFPQGTSFLLSVGMTLLVAFLALGLSLIVNSLAAYAFARLEFPGKKILWLIYAVNMFVPNIAVLIPCYLVVSKMGMTDTLSVLIFPGVTYIWSIFFYRQYYLGIPRSIEEAALIDGCLRIGIYFRMFIPMSVTPFIIMGLSVFQGFWNSYLWPSMVLSSRGTAFYQVNQLLAYLRDTKGTHWDLLLAGTVITCIPLIVILVFMQKYIMQGIKISGIK